MIKSNTKTITCKSVLYSSQTEDKCVELGIQNMQKFYAIALTNGRPDLTTKNHWIKIIHWTHFFLLINNIFFILKYFEYIFKHKYILIEYKSIFFEWQNSYKRKINIAYKNVFLQHFSNHKYYFFHYISMISQLKLTLQNVYIGA